MSYLLDTNTISEPTKPAPNPNLVQWLQQTPKTNLFLSAITIGELWRGVVNPHAPAAKRAHLQKWLHEILLPRFEGRILAFDAKAAQVWANITTEARVSGKTLATLDSQIAAIAMANELILVTHNIADFENIPDLNLFDPWEAE